MLERELRMFILGWREALPQRQVSYTLPVDVHAVAVGAHMHLLGREMKTTATLPGGKKQPLLWIFGLGFQLAGANTCIPPKQIALPKGTILDMEALFDNSEENPNNPNKPPKIVRWGNGTLDEMCECLSADHRSITSNGNAKILARDVQRFGANGRGLVNEWRLTGRK